MVAYLANRIMVGALEYLYVITQRPELKITIDAYLTDKGKSDLIQTL